MTTFPPLVARILNTAAQQGGSAQGFIAAEKNIKNSPTLKLLCAFARRWGVDVPPKGEDYDCRYTSGRNRVADVVRTVLTYLPSQNFQDLLNELQSWLADRVAEAGAKIEPWFTQEFVQIVQSRIDVVELSATERVVEQQAAPLKRELKKDAHNVDMTGLQQKQLQTPQHVSQMSKKIEAPKSAPIYPLITPKARTQYQYRDRSHQFYKLTYNPQSEPRAILADAQHQLVHGPRLFVLDADGDTDAPSTYEKQIRRAVHTKTDELDVPFHEHSLIQPQNRTIITNQLKDASDLVTRGVTDQMDGDGIELAKQHIFAREIDKQVNQYVKAYSDGRGKAKAYYQQMRQSIQYRGGGIRHMNDLPHSQVEYFGAKNRQIPLVHDIDDDFSVADGDEAIVDDFLDKTEDYTGLGIGSLNEIIRSQQQFQSKKEEKKTDDDAPAEVVVVDAKEIRPGYLYRKFTAATVQDKMSIPQFDRQLDPIPFQKKQGENFSSNEQLVKNRVEHFQNELLGGGKKKMDPKVFQAVQVANALFTNEDLGLQSDSEDLKIRDSEESSAGEKEPVEKPKEEIKSPRAGPEKPRNEEFRRRSEQLVRFKDQLDNVVKAPQPQIDAANLLKQMAQNKSKVIQKERKAFEEAEAERLRELKKKAEGADGDKKKKAPKAKAFKPKSIHLMAKTQSGAPAAVETMVSNQQAGNSALSNQKVLAQSIVMELDKIISKDKETEKAYEENVGKKTRQTTVFKALTLAAAQQAKEATNLTSNIKQIIGKTVISGRPLTEEQKRTMENLGQEDGEIARPYTYSRPVIQDILDKKERIVKQAQPEQRLLTEKTYMPAPPPVKEPNTTRGDWATIGRTDQSIIVKQLDQEQNVADIQQMLNQAEMPYIAPIKVQKVQSFEETDENMTKASDVFRAMPTKKFVEAALPGDQSQPDALRTQMALSQTGQQKVTSDLLSLYQKSQKDKQLVKQLETVGVNVVGAKEFNVQQIDTVRTLMNIKPNLGIDPLERDIKQKKVKKAKKVKAK